jgi:hypothetical protein
MSFFANNPLYLFLLIIVILCAAGIFAWVKFGSSIGARLKGPERTPTLVLGKGPETKEEKLLVDNVFYLSNDKTEEAWAFHPDAVQYTLDGSMVGMMVTHDTCLPQYPGYIDMNRMYKSFKESMRPLCLSQFHKAVETEVAKSSSNAMGEWLGFAALVAVGGVLVIVLFIMVKTYFFHG